MKKHKGPRKRRSKKKKKPFELSANACTFYPTESPHRDRAYWTRWVIEAAEAERTRRLMLLKQLQVEEERERGRRQAWAISAIEAEQQSILREMFINSAANTPWFQSTISTLNSDYEVMCPNSWFGCTYSCMLQELDVHLQDCPYRQVPDTLQDPGIDTFSYDIVCPNAIMGCSSIIPRDCVLQHLAICPVGGQSKEQEQEEREHCREHVIVATEEERQRRMLSPHAAYALDRVSGRLHQLYAQHTLNLQRMIHKDIQSFAENCHQVSEERRPDELGVIQMIQQAVNQLWPTARVFPFGSFVTKLNGPDSDLDLVVYNAPVAVATTIELIYALADKLRLEEWVDHVKAIDHASMPIVRVRTKYRNRSIPVDISFDHPTAVTPHNGVACAALISALTQALPGLAETTLVLKRFLAVRQLNRPFSGGLSSYGLTLMVCHVILRQTILVNPLQHDPIDSNDPIYQQQVEFGRQVAEKIVLRAQTPLELQTEAFCGKYLFDFLHSYGDDYQPEYEGLSVFEGGYVSMCNYYTTRRRLIRV